MGGSRSQRRGPIPDNLANAQYLRADRVLFLGVRIVIQSFSRNVSVVLSPVVVRVDGSAS